MIQVLIQIQPMKQLQLPPQPQQQTQQMRLQQFPIQLIVILMVLDMLYSVYLALFSWYCSLSSMEQPPRSLISQKSLFFANKEIQMMNSTILYSCTSCWVVCSFVFSIFMPLNTRFRCSHVLVYKIKHTHYSPQLKPCSVVK